MVKEKITLKIVGMHCATCTITVEKALNKLDTVRANVNFASEKAFIEYDPTKVKISEIKKIIKDTGYDILEEEEEGVNKINLKVSGMASPHCAKIVENALKKINGVIDVKTEFTMERVIVTFDPNVIKLHQMIKAIKDVGYEAREETVVEREKELKEKEIQDLKKRVIISLVFAIPLLFLVWVGWPAYPFHWKKISNFKL